jgi:PPOX class probable F420-dependent enzyme
VKLDRRHCEELLEQAERGVLATRHPDRGVDAVPACFVFDGRRVAIPVDLVKPKTTTALQRVDNLDADPRAALLCDRWDPDDWSRLWWVRATLVRVGVDDSIRMALSPLLAAKYRQYRQQPFADVMVFEVAGLTGWSGEANRSVQP